MNTKVLEEILLEDINNKKIQNDEGKLPSEPELIEYYNVTRYTLRSAFKSLVEQGILYQVHGKGTYIRDKKRNDSIILDKTTGLTDEAKRLGKTLTTVYANLETIKAKDAIYLPEESDISNDEELFFVERLRYLDEEPFVLEYSYYRKKFIPYLNQEIIENSIYDYINQALNIHLGFADKFISCKTCNQEQAEALKLNEGNAMLVLKDEAYLNSGEVFNFSELYYHPDTQFFMLAKMS